MSWKTEDSIKRIFNTFKRVKNQIFEQDIEALKYLNSELKNSQKTHVDNNLLYAKLLVYVLNQNLHHHGNIKTSIKNVSDILKEPLEYHLQMFHKNLNYQDVINYLKSIGIDMESYKKQTDILSKNEKEFIEKLNNNWTYQSVEKSFYNSANDFFKDDKNYI